MLKTHFHQNLKYLQLECVLMCSPPKAAGEIWSPWICYGYVESSRQVQCMEVAKWRIFCSRMTSSTVRHRAAGKKGYYWKWEEEEEEREETWHLQLHGFFLFNPTAWYSQKWMISPPRCDVSGQQKNFSWYKKCFSLESWEKFLQVHFEYL